MTHQQKKTWYLGLKNENQDIRILVLTFHGEKLNEESASFFLWSGTASSF